MTTNAPLTNLSAYREARGLTVAQIAKVLHVNYGTYWAWENYDVIPRKDNVQKLERFFQCSVDELAGMTPETDCEALAETLQAIPLSATPPRDDLVRVTIEGSSDAVARFLAASRDEDLGA